MKNKLKTVIVLIDQIIIIAFIITLAVIIKNIIQDKATSAESTTSEQAVIQVQQEPVSTSETAESTTSEQAVDESSSEIEDTISTSETADSTINEQSEISDETSEPDTNSEVQEDEPGTVSIDLSPEEIDSSWDDIDTSKPVPLTEEEKQAFIQKVKESGTYLH